MLESVIDDPEQEFELNLLVQIKGFGKQSHRQTLAERALRVLQTNTHTKSGILVFYLVENPVLGEGIWDECEQVVRSDRWKNSVGGEEFVPHLDDGPVETVELSRPVPPGHDPFPTSLEWSQP
jgi:hypothetical protein